MLQISQKTRKRYDVKPVFSSNTEVTNGDNDTSRNIMTATNRDNETSTHIVPFLKNARIQTKDNFFSLNFEFPGYQLNLREFLFFYIIQQNISHIISADDFRAKTFDCMVLSDVFKQLKFDEWFPTLNCFKQFGKNLRKKWNKGLNIENLIRRIQNYSLVYEFEVKDFTTISEIKFVSMRGLNESIIDFILSKRRDFYAA